MGVCSAAASSRPDWLAGRKAGRHRWRVVLHLLVLLQGAATELLLLVVPANEQRYQCKSGLLHQKMMMMTRRQRRSHREDARRVALLSCYLWRGNGSSTRHTCCIPTYLPVEVMMDGLRGLSTLGDDPVNYFPVRTLCNISPIIL